MPSIRTSRGTTQAAATTGPANGPRPTWITHFKNHTCASHRGYTRPLHGNFAQKWPPYSNLARTSSTPAIVLNPERYLASSNDLGRVPCGKDSAAAADELIASFSVGTSFAAGGDCLVELCLIAGSHFPAGEAAAAARRLLLILHRKPLHLVVLAFAVHLRKHAFT